MLASINKTIEINEAILIPFDKFLILKRNDFTLCLRLMVLCYVIWNFF